MAFIPTFPLPTCGDCCWGAGGGLSTSAFNCLSKKCYDLNMCCKNCGSKETQPLLPKQEKPKSDPKQEKDMARFKKYAKRKSVKKSVKKSIKKLKNKSKKKSVRKNKL